jgi:hypothetical protein
MHQNAAGMKAGEASLKTVVVTRDGTLSVADHVAEMRAWLAERDIEARELTMLHVLNFRVVFRATFDTVEHADQFATQFG